MTTMIGAQTLFFFCFFLSLLLWLVLLQLSLLLLIAFQQLLLPVYAVGTLSEDLGKPVSQQDQLEIVCNQKHFLEEIRINRKCPLCDRFLFIVPWIFKRSITCF